MPRPCTICTHKDPEIREAIDLGLVRGESGRSLAAKFRVSEDAVNRHRNSHLAPALSTAGTTEPSRTAPRNAAEETRPAPAVLARAEVQQARQERHAFNMAAEMETAWQRARKLSDACEEWLLDADGSGRYNLGPRGEDVAVQYLVEVETGSGTKTERRKAPLDRLLRALDQLEEFGGEKVVAIGGYEPRHADPRELVVKAQQLVHQNLELIAKLGGAMPAPGSTTVNVLVQNPEWKRVEEALVRALKPYPQALAAVAGALRELEPPC